MKDLLNRAIKHDIITNSEQEMLTTRLKDRDINRFTIEEINQFDTLTFIHYIIHIIEI